MRRKHRAFGIRLRLPELLPCLLAVLGAGRTAPCSAGEEPSDPFAGLPNVLYNPLLLPRSELTFDPYSGPPCPSHGGLPPGWILEGHARARVDKHTCSTMPASLALGEIGAGACLASSPCPVQNAKAAAARASVLVRGNPQACKLALRWYLADGSTVVSSGGSPPKEGTFEKVQVKARVPPGAQWVSVVLACGPEAQRVYFDDPFLAFLSDSIEIFCFPLGYHAAGAREAVVRSRMPLAGPYARVKRGDRRREVFLKALQIHPSGFFYYIVDLSTFTDTGTYELEVLDTAVAGRSARASFRLRKDPYREVLREAEEYVKANLTKERLKKLPRREVFQNLLLLAYACRGGFTGKEILKSCVPVLLPGPGPHATYSAGTEAFRAWARAQAALVLGDTELATAARRCLHQIWERASGSGPLTQAALAGAGSTLCQLGRDVLDRDIADDMIRILFEKQTVHGTFPLPEKNAGAAWHIVAATEYLLSVPKSNVRPMARTILDRNLILGERLSTETPFGHARVAAAQGAAVELPRWSEGATCYLLWAAASLLFQATAAPDVGIRYHAERQIQFLYGYNPLGKALAWQRGETLRAARGAKFRPGTPILSLGADPLRAALLLCWCIPHLQDQLAKAQAELEKLRRKRERSSR